MIKRITEGHQRENDSGGSILLHEFVHAVHDRYWGFDFAPILAAYRRAMEQKLYDLGSYLTSNEKEFFACVTQAYFDQADDFPRNHADLKKHDPATLQLLESLWGKRTGLPAAPDATAREIPAFDLNAFNWGTPVVHGPAAPSAESLRNRPVLVVAWNATQPSWIPKVNAWHAELGEFGLVTAAVHLTGSGQTDDVKSIVESRDVKYVVTERPWGAADPVKQFADFPQAYVFDRTGKCVFAGRPFDAEEALRRVVNESLTADLAPEPLPKQLAAIVDQLRGGKTPLSVLALTSGAARSSDAATKAAAAALLTRLTAGAEKRLADAERLLIDDPVEAFVLINKLPEEYRGTTVAARAAALLGRLKRDKRVAIEFQAQPALTMVYKLESELSVQPGSFDPSLPQFQTANAALLGRLQTAVTAMKRTWPASRSAAEAVRIATRYNLQVP
jgi:hypothetical protein